MAFKSSINVTWLNFFYFLFYKKHVLNLVKNEREFDDLVRERLTLYILTNIKF